jgi:hypothetical protein
VGFWLLVCLEEVEPPPTLPKFMADVIQDAQQEFWRPPSAIGSPLAADSPSSLTKQDMAEACSGCSTEFMIGARFCHTCGLSRSVVSTSVPASSAEAVRIAGLWARSVDRVRSHGELVAFAWSRINVPSWLRYLHFHEIKRAVGLPTAALIAFILGLGCVAGAIGVSLFFKASNLAEFQAIQMWRIEWLLGATAAFVAGILLKNPSRND